MAKELAVLSIREYLLKGMAKESKLVAKAFGIQEDVFRAEVDAAISTLKCQKKEVPADNSNALTQIFSEFGPSESHMDALAELFSKQFSKITTVSELYDSIDLHVSKIGEIHNVSASEREAYLLLLATKLAIEGNALGVAHLLAKAGLWGKIPEVAENAISALEKSGNAEEAYCKFTLLSRAGFFKGTSSEALAEKRACLLCDSLLLDIQKGDYGNARRVLIDASEHGIIYASFVEIDLLAGTFSAVKERILYPEAE
jgi:hypothetical protein